MTYNELVDSYNNASGYDAKKKSAEDLIAYYNTHSEELSLMQPEIDELQSVLELNQKLKSLHDEL